MWTPNTPRKNNSNNNNSKQTDWITKITFHGDNNFTEYKNKNKPLVIVKNVSFI